MSNTLVLFAYTDSIGARTNLIFFEKYGMDQSHSYILIINETATPPDLPRLQPSVKWTTVLRRPNEGYDFGAWAAALRTVDIEQYDYFVLLNDTVRGPFMSRNSDGVRPWTMCFTQLLNDKVKLSGISINCTTWLRPTPEPHVQSMLLCTDRIGMRIILPIIREEATDKVQIIRNKELGCSQAILAAGYNISCMLSMYRGSRL